MKEQIRSGSATMLDHVGLEILHSLGHRISRRASNLFVAQETQVRIRGRRIKPRLAVSSLVWEGKRRHRKIIDSHDPVHLAEVAADNPTCCSSFAKRMDRQEIAWKAVECLALAQLDSILAEECLLAPKRVGPFIFAFQDASKMIQLKKKAKIPLVEMSCCTILRNRSSRRICLAVDQWTTVQSMSLKLERTLRRRRFDLHAVLTIVRPP